MTEAKNVIPSENGFQPLNQAVASTTALRATCRGAVSVLLDDGTVQTFAGDANRLYRLTSDARWDNVSATEVVTDDSLVTIVDDAAADITITGDDYAVGAGELWKFDLYGNLLIATNVIDGPQKFNVTSSSNFADLGGSPPAARYIAVVGEFVFLGAIANNEKRVQWSAIGNAEGWTAGSNESDYQDFPNGGPVRGLIGGESIYVFQAAKLTRGIYQPGSATIFSFDEIEGGAGLAAPHSLVRLRDAAFYLAPDGFRKLSLAGAASSLIGGGKWAKWFLADRKAGSDLSVIGAAHPAKPLIFWAYVSSSNVSTTPDRLLIYDWALDEATYADLSVETLLQWLSPGVSLDALDPYGTMETLPFPLDSPFWRGGAALMGVFTTDHKLSLQSGTPMAATITTADGYKGRRHLFKGARPMIDTAAATIALAVRERDADQVSFGAAEAMNDIGICPAHKSGLIARAKLSVPAGSTWTAAKGIETFATPQGQR